MYINYTHIYKLYMYILLFYFLKGFDVRVFSSLFGGETASPLAVVRDNVCEV